MQLVAMYFYSSFMFCSRFVFLSCPKNKYTMRMWLGQEIKLFVGTNQLYVNKVTVNLFLWWFPKFVFISYCRSQRYQKQKQNSVGKTPAKWEYSRFMVNNAVLSYNIVTWNKHYHVRVSEWKKKQQYAVCWFKLMTNVISHVKIA